MSEKISKNLVMIVGMHRSGTSAVGRLLDNMGFEFGNNLLQGIRSINDDGFWEDKEVVALNEHIFDLYDFEWFDFERMPGKWWEDEHIKNLVGVAETWYYETFTHEAPIAVKDPRFCRLLPFWKRIFQGLELELDILFVFRHPVEVAASLKKRDSFPMQLGYLLWLCYTIDALYYSRNLRLTLLCYEHFVAEPTKIVDYLFDEVFSDVIPCPGKERRELAAKSLDLNKRHQKSKDLMDGRVSQGDIQALAMELYQDLLEADSDKAKGLADKYRKRLYRLLDHHKEVLLALREETHNQVLNVQNLFKLGSDHEHALSVIREKDDQLEENKEFIRRCLDEIQNKEVLLKSVENSSVSIDSVSLVDSYTEKFDVWMASLNKLIDDYKIRIDEQNKYIKECEEKLVFKERGLADNQEYIAKCHARISEQDAGIAENRGYIIACENRIRTQDEGLSIRDIALEEKSSRILELEKLIILLKENISSLEKNIFVVEDKNRQLVENISRYQAQFEQQEKSLSECYSQISTGKEKISDGILKNEHLEKTLADLHQKLGEYSEKIRAVEGALIESRETAGELNRIVLERDILLQENRTLISEQAYKITEKEALLVEKEKLLDIARQEIANAFAEVNRLQALDRINHQRLSLQKSQLEKLKAHSAAIESELIALRAEHEESTHFLERYRSYRIVKIIDKLFPEA